MHIDYYRITGLIQYSPWQDQSKTNQIEIEIDTKITPELKMEGTTREIIRQIQMLRKKTGLTPEDIVKLKFNTKEKDIVEAIEKYQKQIAKETKLKDIIKLGDLEENPLKIDGKTLFVNLEK